MNFNFPMLYSKTKTGKIQQWQVFVEKRNDCNCYNIVTKFGQQDGIIQETRKIIEVGKNIGKANETTTEQQAVSEAESMWKKKKLSNYRESLEDDLTMLPMLAHKYDPANPKVVYPCCVQPKLNGVRCLATLKDGKVIFTSRKGKIYDNLGHIETQLLKVMNYGDVYDGELFNPDLDFQEIVKRVKRSKTDRSDIDDIKIQYWVYDKVDLEKPFINRINDLIIILSTFDLNGLVKITPTFKNIENFEQLKEKHGVFTGQNFEGTMIRNNNGKYTTEFRSYDLLKLKDFLEDEFVIVGGSEGTGRDTGTIIFEVENKEGKKFSVRPKGTHKQRTEWFNDLSILIGKKLTVKYQELSQDGIPIFPVGLSIRDYE